MLNLARREPKWRGRISELPLALAVFSGVCVHIFAWAALIAGHAVRTPKGLTFVLNDDAMISMDYARNFASGRGLVYADHQRVEGFTNLLWTLVMAGWNSISLSERFTSLAVQLTNFALDISIALLIINATRLLCSDKRARLAAITIFLFGQLLNFVYWGAAGFENPLVALGLLLSLRACVTVRSNYRKSIFFWAISSVAMVITREDTLPIVIASGIVLALCARPALREGKKKHVLAYALASPLVAFAAVLLWQRLYYGSWLSNTFYDKVAGFPLGERLTHGLSYTASWLKSAWPMFVPVVVVGLIRPFRSKAPREIWFFSIPMGAQIVYAIYVGGDVFQYSRFFTEIFPPLCIMTGVCLVIIWQNLLDIWVPTRMAYGALLILIAMAPTPISFWQSFRVDTRLTVAPASSTSYYTWNVITGMWLRAHAEPSATVAGFWAGTVPYFSHLEPVDLLGLADSHVAHERPDVDSGYIPGHSKFDFDYSLGVVKPDIVVSNVAQPAIPLSSGLVPYGLTWFDEFSHGAYSFSVRMFSNLKFDQLYYKNQLDSRVGPFIFVRDGAQRLIHGARYIAPPAHLPR